MPRAEAATRVEAVTHVGAHLVAHQHRRPALGQATHDQFVAMLMVATWLGLGVRFRFRLRLRLRLGLRQG